MILVVGGTGQLGARVVNGLVERGESVRCLVRPQTNDGDLRELGAEVSRGDLTKHDTLHRACEGITTVVVTATAITRRLAGVKHPAIREVDEIGIMALVDAAEKTGVQRFVYLSIAGLEDALDCPLVRAKRAVERRLSNSPMHTVILRPDAFQDVHLAPLGRFDLKAGKVAVFGRGDCRHRWVSVEDVAQLVVAVALEIHPSGMIEFGGPESLSRNETVALAERLMGRSFRKQRVPRVIARIGMRLLDRPNDALASILGLGLHQDLVEADWDDTPFAGPRDSAEVDNRLAGGTGGARLELMDPWPRSRARAVRQQRRFGLAGVFTVRQGPDGSRQNPHCRAGRTQKPTGYGARGADPEGDVQRPSLADPPADNSTTSQAERPSETPQGDAFYQETDRPLMRRGQ